MPATCSPIIQADDHWRQALNQLLTASENYQTAIRTSGGDASLMTPAKKQLARAAVNFGTADECLVRYGHRLRVDDLRGSELAEAAIAYCRDLRRQDRAQHYSRDAGSIDRAGRLLDASREDLLAAAAAAP